MSGYMNERSLALDELHRDYHHHHQQQQYHSDISSSMTSSGGKSNNNINHQKLQSNNNSSSGEEEDEDDELGMMMDLRRGPWTVEEDHTLMSYISKHGEGRWNSLARCAGLKRTGKSCRLRWLNYLRPDVRRGNITLEEQLLILELHSRWGNRWSKIAQHLPGRTDNEIKNYWRTRVQKHAKQLKCDVNSKQFKDTMRYLWIPRLVERIQAAAASGSSSTQTPTTHFPNHHEMISSPMTTPANFPGYVYSENSSTTAASSDSFNAQVSPISDLTETYQNPGSYGYYSGCNNGQIDYMDSLVSPAGYYHPQSANFQTPEQNNNNNNNNVNQWTVEGGDLSDNMWNVEDIWLLQQQQFSNNYLN